jgi:glycosyltransferase involved in cell wall biosynthesis
VLDCRRRRARQHVSVVIPAKNEERNLPWVLERMPDLVDEIILVDGCSTDRTVAVARWLRPDIRVVTQAGRGKGDALRAGFDAAYGDFIVMIDADGSMDPGEIPACIAELHDRRALGRSGSYELVKGSRFMHGGGTDDMSPVRRMGNSLLLRLVNALYSADFTDLCYGLIAFRRDQLDHLGLESDGFEIETEIVVRGLKAGVRIGEVASFEKSRIHGESNLRTWRDGSRVLATLLKERLRGFRDVAADTPS